MGYHTKTRHSQEGMIKTKIKAKPINVIVQQPHPLCSWNNTWWSLHTHKTRRKHKQIKIQTVPRNLTLDDVRVGFGCWGVWYLLQKRLAFIAALPWGGGENIQLPMSVHWEQRLRIMVLYYYYTERKGTEYSLLRRVEFWWARTMKLIILLAIYCWRGTSKVPHGIWTAQLRRFFVPHIWCNIYI